MRYRTWNRQDIIVAAHNGSTLGHQMNSRELALISAVSSLPGPEALMNARTPMTQSASDLQAYLCSQKQYRTGSVLGHGAIRQWPQSIYSEESGGLPNPKQIAIPLPLLDWRSETKFADMQPYMAVPVAGEIAAAASLQRRRLVVPAVVCHDGQTWTLRILCVLSIL